MGAWVLMKAREFHEIKGNCSHVLQVLMHFRQHSAVCVLYLKDEDTGKSLLLDC
jgi:hypothetical protein